MRLQAFALTMLLAAFATPAHAADPAVEALLKAADLGYEVDKDGDYKLVIEWTKEERTQLAYLAGAVEEIDQVRIYTLMSPAYIIPDGGLDADLARSLLSKNAQYKIGAWEVAGKTLYFTAKFPTTITAQQLHKLVFTVTEEADDMEIELTDGKDDL